MKMVRVGKFILNMELLVAVRDDGDRMSLLFSGGVVSQENNQHSSVMLIKGEACNLLRQWLNRMGVQDLAKEFPVYPGVWIIGDDSDQARVIKKEYPLNEHT